MPGSKEVQELTVTMKQTAMYVFTLRLLNARLLSSLLFQAVKSLS
jgi:hypothetical protein